MFVRGEKGKTGKSQTSEKISLQISEVFKHSQIFASLILVVFFASTLIRQGRSLGVWFGWEDMQKSVFYSSEKLTYYDSVSETSCPQKVR